MNKNTKVTSSNNRIKHLHSQIESLKDIDTLQKIFEVLTLDDNFEYINNPDGVFINLASLSSSTIKKVDAIIKTWSNRQEVEPITESIKSKSTTVLESKTKLNNHEKNLLKQRDIKKRLDGYKNYEIYKFS